MSWYGFFKRLLGVGVRSISHVEVRGLENIPDQGPFILIPNHQSVLDPIYIQSAIPRNDLHTLTKSTQFAGPVFRWALPRVNAFPVRRFRVDPQAVRMVLRHLEGGRGVCMYPEGERSWDGSLQPLKLGSIRVILKAAVPVVPCWIQGSYDVWPRWSRRVSRQRVHILFGDPLHFGAHDEREAREAALDDARTRIIRALVELSVSASTGSAATSSQPSGGSPSQSPRTVREPQPPHQASGQSAETSFPADAGAGRK